jgi:drug/metabolite transporter (DMT)-like permease
VVSEQQNRPPRSLWIVIALLIAAAFLISLPAAQAPSAADVCNARTNEAQDHLEADKESAAITVLLGALASLAAAVVAFPIAARRTRSYKPQLLFLGVLGLVGLAAGLYLAFATALIVC